MKIIFFSMRTFTFGWPSSPPPVRSCLLLVDPPPHPTCGHPLWMPQQNVPPDPKLLFGDDLNNRIKLLQTINKACKVSITPNNSRYYQQNYSPNFSRTQHNSKNFKAFSKRTTLIKRPL